MFVGLRVWRLEKRRLPETGRFYLESIAFCGSEKEGMSGGWEENREGGADGRKDGITSRSSDT